jgi:hypothetical protein
MGINVNISYNKEMIAAAAAAEREKMNEGFFPAVCTGADSDVSKEKEDPKTGVIKGNNLMHVLEFHVLKDADDSTSTWGPRLRKWLVAPFPNPDKPGHEPAPGTARMLNRSLSALFPDEIPALPELRKGKLVYQDEEITEGQKAEIDVEVLEKVFAKSAELLKDPSAFLRRQVVVKIGYGKDNPDFPEIQGLYSALPDGAEFVAPDKYTRKAAPKSAVAKAKGKAKRG